MRKNEVKAVSDIEHVKLRPSMYIGSTQMESLKRWTLHEGKLEYREVEFVAGLLKMFDEIISNSIDEAFRTNFRKANKIQVNVARNKISIQDNGRGIPLKKAEGSDITQAEMALTQLRAGANFQDEAFVSIGTHGLGASLVNILSSKFVAWTDDGSGRMELECFSGLETKNVKLVPTKGRTGTFIQFYPDFLRFGCREISGDLLSLIEKRVNDLAVCFPKIRFKFNGSTVHVRKFQNYVRLASETFESIELENASIAVFPSEEPNQISFVNGIDTYEGGTHVDYVRNQIVSEVLQKLNKKHKKLGLKPADIRNKLTFVVISNGIENPKFRSQTKEYISNNHKDYEGILDKLNETDLVKKILKNDDLILPIIETKKLKLEAAERVQLKKDLKRAKKIKVVKHVPANGKPKDSILYITEGQSASGMLTKVRDPMRHGCYPLRGKPLNTFGMKFSEIIKNKELQELMTVLGIQLGDGDLSNMNYGKIRIMADADYDGHSIVSLILVFLSNWPELFNRGMISVVRCPIMILSKGKIKKRIYDLKDYHEMIADGTVDSSWKMDYFKGLGSLPEAEYHSMIHEPHEDVIDMLSLVDKDSLEMAFGNDSSRRKEWLS